MSISNIKIASIVFQLIISISIVYYLLKNKIYTFNKANCSKTPIHNLVNNLFILTSIVFVFYLTFYINSDYIYSFQRIISESEVTPIIRPFLEKKNGIESIVLFLGITCLLFLSYLVHLINQSKYTYTHPQIIITITGFITILFINSIKFYPPHANINNFNFLDLSIQLISIILIVETLNYYYNRQILIFYVLFLLLLLPICFIQYEPISLFDYQYILIPALKIYHNIELKDIYFQYDLFISLLTYMWMKIEPSLKHIHLLGQFSLYLFFSALLIFSKKLFTNKNLIVYFISIAILVRLYGIEHDPVRILQVTPLRLDLWLLLIIVCFKFGHKNWLLSFCIALLFFFHRNFGTLYLASYLLLLFSNYLMDCVENYDSTNYFKYLYKHTIHYLKSIYINILILSSSLGIVYYFYGSFYSSSASLYQKLGIGMLPISMQSIYWYVPVLLTFTFYLLLLNKSLLKKSYFYTVVFVLFLTISNSMYFFGRSHEHNIINISTIIILVFFIFLDLLNLYFVNNSLIKTSHKLKSILKHIPKLVIILFVFYYSNNISTKFSNIHYYIKRGKINCPFPIPSQKDFYTIRSITKNSTNIYFISHTFDFSYYYYGNYIPIGYFSPYASMIYKKDMILYFNKLLKNNYYIVIPKINLYDNTIDITQMSEISEILPLLKYNNKYENNSLLIIWSAK